MSRFKYTTAFKAGSPLDKLRPSFLRQVFRWSLFPYIVVAGRLFQEHGDDIKAVLPDLQEQRAWVIAYRKLRRYTYTNLYICGRPMLAM